MKTRWISFLVAASSFLLPTFAWAQSSITGVVRDGSGAVLPGVTVEASSPALIERVRSTVTDDQGRYRIVDLRPGTYAVTFALTGFTTSKRDGLDLRAEFTATVNADLAVGALEETVTVSGDAPIVDLRSSRAQVQFAQETLQSLPGTGRLATLPAILPAVVVGRESDRGVGGLSDRTQTAYSLHGAPEAQPVVDGVNHQVASLTSGVFVYNQINIQEVVVETSGVGADRDSGGMQLNMIPRDGGNVFSGLATFAYVGPSLEASNINDDLLARHLDPKRIGSIKKFRDSAAALGGPISRDKLWFYASFREGVTQQYAEGLYFNKLKQPQTLLYEPDLSRPVNSNDYSRDLSVRFTWQAAPKHKIVLMHSIQPNCNCRFNLLNPGARRTPEAAGEHHYDPHYLSSASWTNPVTSRILLEAGTTIYVINQNDIREPGFPETNIQVTDQGLNLWMHNGSLNYRFRNGVPNQVTLTDAPWNFEESVRDIALYAQDQWTFKRATLNAGLRYSDAKARTPEQVLGAGFFVPERRFAPVDNIPHYRNLSPRIGFAYDLFGTGRTALKASLGHYPDRVIQASANPAVNLTRTTSRNWTDGNANSRPDCVLLDPAANGECGAWSNLNFGKANAETRYAADAQSGFNDQFHNWQGSVSFQHELRPGMGLNVGYFRTWYGGFLTTDNQLTSASDYDPFCITVPSDSRLPNSGQQLCGLYDIKPGGFGSVDNLVTQTSHYGKATQVFNGVDVTLSARYGQGGQFSGGLSAGRTATNNCYQNGDPSLTAQVFPGVLALPTATAMFPTTATISKSTAFCDVSPPWSQSTQVKFMAVYPLPWHIQTSAIYQNSSGIPITASYVATNAEILPSLGRNLGSCRGAATCNGNVTVELIPPNSVFEPRLQQVGLRFSRIFQFGTRKLRGDVDIYNLLNASNVLNMNTTYSPPGGVWQDVTQILGGRLVRLGMQLEW